MIHCTQAQALMQMGFHSTRSPQLHKSGGRVSAKKNTPPSHKSRGRKVPAKKNTHVATCPPQRSIPADVAASKKNRPSLGNNDDRCLDRANQALAQMGLNPVDWRRGEKTGATVRTTSSTACTSIHSDYSTVEEGKEEVRTAAQHPFTSGYSTTSAEEGKEEEGGTEFRGARGTTPSGTGLRRVFLHLHRQQPPLSVDHRETAARERAGDLGNPRNGPDGVFVCIQKRDEPPENKDGQIQFRSDLAAQKREANAVLASWDSKREIVKGMGEIRVTENEQLSDDIKRRDATIGRLNKELARTKREAKEALEEVKESEATKRREITVLQNTVTNISNRSDAFADEVAKLKAAIVSRDTQLGDAQSKIISQERLLVSSVHKLEREHSDRIAALDSEIDGLKTHAESEAIVPRRNGAEPERSSGKIAVGGGEIIERQKGRRTAGPCGNKVAELEAEIASRDAELEDARSTIARMENARTEREIFDPLYSQARLLGSSVERLKREYSDRVAALGNEIDKLKVSSECEAIVSRQNAAEIERLEKMVAQQDEIIELRDGYRPDVERELANRTLIDEATRQEKYLDEKLKRVDGLFAELQEEFRMCLQDIRVPACFHRRIEDRTDKQATTPNIPITPHNMK